MNRRTFLTASVIGTVTAGISSAASAVEKYFPLKVDSTLFDSINRIKIPGKKTPLEMSHSPFITVPKSVKSGEIFTVEVSVGEKVHDMGPTHWIEYIELAIGNESVGRVNFQSRGFLKPKATFNIALTKELAPNGLVSLIVYQRCNLHGLWESTVDIEVA